MKNLVFFLLLILPMYSSAQDKITDLKRLGIKGNVTEYSESSYEVVQNFDEIEKGKLTMVIRMTFNEDGNMLLKERVSIEEHSNERKSRKKRKELTNSEIKYKDIYIYNAQGILIEIQHSSPRKKKYELDNKGRIVAEWYTYDDITTTKTVYKYDEHGNNIEEISYDKDGLRSKKLLIYNEKNQLVESITNASYMFMHFKYEYNNLGFESKCQSIRKDNSTTTYEKEYELDSVGNWVRKIGLKSHKPSYIIERIITYAEE